MAGSALNVREDQWSADRKALRVARQNYYAALRLVGRQVVLYRPRGERDPGYYGLADIINVEPDRCDAQRIWIKIDNVSAFDAPISLDQMFGSNLVLDHPFHTYSRALRPLSPYEREYLMAAGGIAQSAGSSEGLLADPATEPGVRRWTERKQLLRKRVLRDHMLRLCGPECAFTGAVQWSLLMASAATLRSGT